MKLYKLLGLLALTIFVGCSSNKEKNFSTKSFKIGIQELGAISSLIDVTTNKNYEFLDK